MDRYILPTTYIEKSIFNKRRPDTRSQMRTPAKNTTLWQFLAIALKIYKKKSVFNRLQQPIS